MFVSEQLVRKVVMVAVLSCGVLFPAAANNQPLNVNGARSVTEQRQRQREDLRRLATIGLLFGAIETEAAVERAVGRQLRDLRTTQGSPHHQQQAALTGLTSVLERGRIALELLNHGLELAAAPPLPRTLSSSGDYRRELRKRSQQSVPRTIRLTARSDSNSNGTNITTTPQQTQQPPIEQQVEEQLEQMRNRLATRIRRTVQHLEQQQQQQGAGGGGLDVTRLDIATVQRLLAQITPPSGTTGGHWRRRRFQDLLQSEGLQQHIERLFRRRQDADGGVAAEDEESSSSASSEEQDGGPGGLVGLIASLSGGGDEGSDVGALIGTLSGLITNLFGPGGLDIPGLLGTGTSLIAGLLGGDDNFGKVLGSYVGIAIEGLSGGGADMNGAFFGNFLGALLAALSSDPEDESLPLRPKLFVENFFSGLQEAKRKDDPQEGGDQGQHPGGSGSGSDLFGFITHVVSSVVGGITSLVLNASLGSSGGSSQGSVDASGASTSGSSGGHR
ncbi:uncharacterized protein LOC125956308 [Anopheles darlingi]|uniref:uncharacterized protein LOC125956308 n=1 Tax=Anopheles darlingi TaxID=43151 RepID=UPI0021006212|nr:uncharacterized protein LOC125956308 [Anopheles darlingi]